MNNRVGFQVGLFAAMLLLLSGSYTAVANPDKNILLKGPAVAYQPKGYIPGAEVENVTEQSIRDDLRLLHSTGFRGLVTYSAQGILGKIPELARQEGFDGTIVMGIWNLESEEEWRNAIAQMQFVDSYCIGNEGLGVRYSAESLAAKMTEMKSISNRAVTTTEPIESYLSGPYRQVLVNNSDWLFPFAHPLWAGYAEPEKAVQWTTIQHDYLVAMSGKQVILKEVGLPSAGEDNLNEEMQLTFYQGIKKTEIPFFYFEAFDQPWKLTEPGFTMVEVHWGIFRQNGEPKKVAQWLGSELVE